MQPTATTAPAAAIYVDSMTGKATTRRGTTVSFTVIIKDLNGSAVSGAGVTIALLAPDGSSWSLTATTNSCGQTSWSAKATGGSGTYLTSVTDVTASNRTHDASFKVVSSVAIAVP